MFDPRQSFAPVHRLRDEFDRLFNTAFSGVGFPINGGMTDEFPALNIWEKDEEYFVEAEVPGLTMDDLEIFVKENEVSITGERKAWNENVTYHRRERGMGRFRRVVRLPAEIDAEKVEARLKDGVLTLVLPKAESAKPRKITVHHQA